MRTEGLQKRLWLLILLPVLSLWFENIGVVVAPHADPVAPPRRKKGEVPNPQGPSPARMREAQDLVGQINDNNTWYKVMNISEEASIRSIELRYETMKNTLDIAPDSYSLATAKSALFNAIRNAQNKFKAAFDSFRVWGHEKSTKITFYSRSWDIENASKQNKVECIHPGGLKKTLNVRFFFDGDELKCKVKKAFFSFRGHYDSVKRLDLKCLNCRLTLDEATGYVRVTKKPKKAVIRKAKVKYFFKKLTNKRKARQELDSVMNQPMPFLVLQKAVMKKLREARFMYIKKKGLIKKYYRIKFTDRH